MESATDPSRMLAFLRALRANNDRQWFEAHRKDWEEARAVHERIVASIISRLGEVDDLEVAAPRDSIFRLNRDVRFSADKSPYKTAFGALMGPAGRKSGVRAYYLHLEPDGKSFVGGGLHHPAPGELAAVRKAIASDPKPLRRILSAQAFVREFGGLSGESLKTAPSGFAKDHPDLDLLRWKQYLAARPLADSFVDSGDLVGEALRAFKAMRPFLLYLESVLRPGTAGPGSGGPRRS